MNIERTVACTPSIIMVAMFRPTTFLAVSAGLLSCTLTFAQTPPPGAPFDAMKHPNPIVTFVESKDFRTATSDQIRKESGIELIGISRDEGKPGPVEIA